MSNPRFSDSTETLEFVGLLPPSRVPDPARPPIRVEFAAISHPGKVRVNNEDHFLVLRLGRTYQSVATNMPSGTIPDLVDEAAYGMVVADGMGGMAAGEKASQLAIRTGVDLVLSNPMWTTRVAPKDAEPLIERLRSYIRRVDEVVIGEGKSDQHLHGMGTTLTLAYLVDHHAFLVHVGDSRAYLFRKGKLQQLTKDHTMAQGLADLGEIKAEDVHRHAKRHVLTNFVGGPSHGVVPEVHIIPLEDGDYLLLCSDGLSEMVKDAEIAGAFRPGAATDDIAKTLIDLALEGGGRDNVTVVLARIEVPTGPPSRPR